MKVKDAIAALSQCDPDAEFLVNTYLMDDRIISGLCRKPITAFQSQFLFVDSAGEWYVRWDTKNPEQGVPPSFRSTLAEAQEEYKRERPGQPLPTRKAVWFE